MNKTLQNILAKCINEEQSNWSQQLPYFMMAYWSSEQESTGYTPQFLVYGQELSVPLDCMYLSPQENETIDLHQFVHKKKQAFQRAFELVRRNLNEKQKRRNAICNKKVHGPLYKEGQKVFFFHPAIAIGTTSHFKSSWKGPYIIEKCLNDVTFRIKEENSTKQQIVHYDRLKPFFDPPPTSNLPIRNKSKNDQLTQNRADTHKYTDGTLNHDDCLSYLPAPSSILAPIPAVGRTTTSITTCRNTPSTSSASEKPELTRLPLVLSRSPTLEQPSPHMTLPYNHRPLITLTYSLSYLGMPFATKDNHHAITSRKLWTLQPEILGKHLLQTRPKCSYDLTRHHKEGYNRLYWQPSSQLKGTTTLPDILTDYNSAERKLQKQSGSNFNKTPTGKRENHQQK